ncbi:MAG: sigma-70 family RNA polymerase sigma factor [Kiritimatiellae bacterium]|nr:sigma-70 family RNA polymerase sigma factor [Kiritimatiellia bacterium]
MEKPDELLIDRYRKGHVEDLEELVLRYRRQLFGFIVDMMGSSNDADEIFQEVWYRVIRKLKLYKQKNFLGWLIRIARNIIIDRSRKRKPDVSLDAENEDGGSLCDTIAGAGPGPSDRIKAGDLSERLCRAIAVLPEEQREVFMMRVRAEISFKEIADIQGVSINTALARMQYAVTKLRPMLLKDYGELCADRERTA